MKVLTILGTRPEIIRLSMTIERLDRVCDHVVVHTGQNFDPELDAVFFNELGVRTPDHYLGARGDFGKQAATILHGIEKVLETEQPDRFLVLGDTNSSLAAIMAKRLGFPVFHMEAGNRCYDDRCPEEVNRRIVDHVSDILLPYTERSRANLLREGFPGERIYVTGNPIFEVIQAFGSRIAASSIRSTLDLPGKYILATMHRAENVDVAARLRALVLSLDRLQRAFDMPVVVSTHPHTRKSMQAFGIDTQNAAIRFLKPLGFFDFVALEKAAACVVSDSGTIQEECAILGVPNVVCRDTTERPETIETGSSMLGGVEPEMLVNCVRTMMERNFSPRAPYEYLVDNVSGTVANIVLGHCARNRQ